MSVVYRPVSLLFQARALDKSLATITRLESAAAGGVKGGGAAYMDQLAGQEQLQVTHQHPLDKRESSRKVTSYSSSF